MFFKLLAKIKHSVACRIKNAAAAARLKTIRFLNARKNRVTAETIVQGVRMCVLADDDIGQQLVALKEFEPLDWKYIKSISQPDWTCFDIGANIGYWSLLLAKNCPKGTIHSFEPSELPFALLNVNVALNGFNNIKTNKIALGDFEGERDFVVSRDSGFSSFADTHRKLVDKTIKVPVTTIDKYVTSNKIKSIDFFKVDVEGAEKMVLDGAAKTLKQGIIKLILIELTDQNLKSFGESVGSVTSLLKSYGYRPFKIDPVSKNPADFSKDDYDKVYNVYFRK
jgi:FkbM family methyltransferase